MVTMVAVHGAMALHGVAETLAVHGAVALLVVVELLALGKYFLTNIIIIVLQSTTHHLTPDGV